MTQSSDTSGEHPSIAFADTPSPPSPYRKAALNGLWKNNAALVQLLGLCPLLAVSNSTVNALGLGLATLFVLVVSNTIVSLVRHQVQSAIRLPVFVMVIAAATTCIELVMQAVTFQLYEVLGIFIPLIVTNCAVLGRADAFACKNPVGLSAWDGAVTGFGFCWVLLLVGMIRELLGQGTLCANMQLLLPFWPESAHFSFGPNYRQFLLAALPPGAFITVGVLVALKAGIDRWLTQHANCKKTPIVAGSKRVRVTGQIT